MVVNHERIRVTAAAATLLFLAVGIALTAVTHDPWPTNDGIAFVVLTAYGVVGYVIARAEPRNPIGWIFIALSLFTLFDYVMRLYLVLDYRERGGGLPLGQAAQFWRGGWSIFPLILAMPAIVLFPDGRLSRRWRRLMWVYVVCGVVFVMLQFTGQIVQGGSDPVVVDLRGNLPNNNNGWVSGVGWLLGPFFLLAWCSFVVHQILAWRSSSGIRRVQLKWLAAGSAVLVISCVLLVMLGDGSSVGARVVADLATIGIGVLAVAVGVAILRFRLYEIDRLISRTLSYAIVTGTLAAVFVGTVVLTTDVLPFSSPVAVAASTLTAAALFNPLRSRVQRAVDRRFNRARFDAERTVEAFARRLRDAVDLDTVRDGLMQTIDQAVEPAHVTVWVRDGA